MARILAASPLPTSKISSASSRQTSAYARWLPSHPSACSLRHKITIKPFRFLTVLQSPLPAFPSFSIYKRNLLKAPGGNLRPGH
jgi:hypothetical protein